MRHDSGPSNNISRRMEGVALSVLLVERQGTACLGTKVTKTTGCFYIWKNVGVLKKSGTQEIAELSAFFPEISAFWP